MITEKGFNMDFMFRNSKYIVSVIDTKSDSTAGDGSSFVEKIVNIYKKEVQSTQEVGLMLFLPWLKLGKNQKTLKVGGQDYILLGKDRDMAITHSVIFHEDGATPKRNIITTFMQTGRIHFLEDLTELNPLLKKLGVELEWEEIQRIVVIDKISEGS